MSEKDKSYQAYLLRLWRVREARDTWRVSLEDAQTRELRGFGSLEELLAFLNTQLLLPPPEPESPSAEVEEGQGLLNEE